jgi:hypothetical protein
MSEKGRRAVRWAGVIAAALLVGSASARGPEDDLTLVKRAVGEDPPAAQETEARSKPKGEARWLKVRIHETRGKKARVTINLPLSLARALGDDIPIDWGHRHRDGKHRHIRLSEILEALEAGQELVQIDSDDGTVRVWVE